MNIDPLREALGPRERLQRPGLRSLLQNFLRGRKNIVFSNNREANSPIPSPVSLVGTILGVISLIVAFQPSWASPSHLVVRAPAILLSLLLSPYLWVVYHKYVSMMHPGVVSPHVKRLASVTIFFPTTIGVILGCYGFPAYFLGCCLAVGSCLAWWTAYMFNSRIEDCYEHIVEVWEQALPDLKQDTRDQLQVLLNSSPKRKIVLVELSLGIASDWKVVNATFAVAIIVVCFLYPYQPLLEAAQKVLEPASGVGGVHQPALKLTALFEASILGVCRIGWLFFLFLGITRVGNGSSSETFVNYRKFEDEVSIFNAVWDVAGKIAKNKSNG